jgi:hypothetical protein
MLAPPREMPADTHLMELQNPQNVVLHTDGHLYRVLAALDKAKPNTGLKRGCGQAHDLSSNLSCMIANAE